MNNISQLRARNPLSTSAYRARCSPHRVSQHISRGPTFSDTYRVNQQVSFLSPNRVHRVDLLVPTPTLACVANIHRVDLRVPTLTFACVNSQLRRSCVGAAAASCAAAAPAVRSCVSQFQLPTSLLRRSCVFCGCGCFLCGCGCGYSRSIGHWQSIVGNLTPAGLVGNTPAEARRQPKRKGELDEVTWHELRELLAKLSSCEARNTFVRVSVGRGELRVGA
jgi:hypothetical protein